jgi:hypothetical protein
MMKARKDVKVVMVGSDGVSYGVMPAKGGTWRELMIKEVGKDIDHSRLAFPGRVPYETYLALLKRSDAHVYLTYPFVASWSLRESLAAGCTVIGSDTQPVREFVSDGETGLLTSFFDPPGLADKILTVLEDRALSDRLRRNARAYAEKSLSMADYLAAYEGVIERLTGQSLVSGPSSSSRQSVHAGEARFEATATVSHVPDGADDASETTTSSSSAVRIRRGRKAKPGVGREVKVARSAEAAASLPRGKAARGRTSEGSEPEGAASGNGKHDAAQAAVPPQAGTARTHNRAHGTPPRARKSAPPPAVASATLERHASLERRAKADRSRRAGARSAT